MIPAGRLREPASLLEPTGTGRERSGEPTYSDVAVADIWVGVSALSARRSDIAGQYGARVTLEVLARYDSRIRPGMGLLLRDGRVLNIEGVRDERGGRESLVLMCSESVQNGSVDVPG